LASEVCLEEDAMSDGVDQPNDNEKADQQVTGGEGTGGEVSGSAAGATTAPAGHEGTGKTANDDGDALGDSLGAAAAGPAI
jgi:hypothetical protein